MAEKTKCRPMMKCGHVANSVDMRTGKPSCAICAGIDPGADVVDDNPPDITGRLAECAQCGRTVASDPNLAFFEYRPDYEYDGYYCGCRGWD